MNSITYKTNDIRALLNFMGKELALSENDKFRIEKIKELCHDIDLQSEILKEVIVSIGARNQVS